MSNPTSILAVFTPKAPVEPTAPKDKAYESDDNFKDFLDDAIKSNPSKESNASSTKEDKNLRSDAAETKRLNQDNKQARDSVKGNEAAQQNKQSAATDGSQQVDKQAKLSKEETQALIEDLEAMGASKEQIDALLRILQSGDAGEATAFLQSFLNNNPQQMQSAVSDSETNLTDPTEMTEEMQRQRNQAIDLLAQSGVSKEQAKDLINKMQARQDAHIAASQANAEKAKLASQNKDNLLENAETEDKPDFFTQLGLKSHKVEDPKSGESALKNADAPKETKGPRIVTPDTGDKAAGQKRQEGEAQIDVKIQGGAPVAPRQTTDTLAAMKGPDGMKATLEVQAPGAPTSADSSSKTQEAAKPVLPESFAGRGAGETKIVNQIIEKFSIRTTGNQNEVKIRLDPPSMGSVRMSISTVGDSVRTTIVAENHAVKQAIENNLAQLKESMSAQGLNIDEINVLVGGDPGNSFHQETPAKQEVPEQAFSDFMEQQPVKSETFYQPNPGINNVFDANTRSLSVVA
ncbi:MAG: hypothetical protein G3M78_06845 [Candidatus Nitrohelix vancouverensis]|uniref:Flagellar hook-length control protein-like C-terminal domain-containing protein n=1 Tax=Candidatus Nitrohelix vancouverensis TaxID=2705534 RepID=A0A7T0G374_9BACT|nr:MAG: hypothetical protein G3M78_06845 [Candidatus Nitrohelix vancouverensis]